MIRSIKSLLLIYVLAIGGLVFGMAALVWVACVLFIVATATRA